MHTTNDRRRPPNITLGLTARLDATLAGRGANMLSISVPDHAALRTPKDHTVEYRPDDTLDDLKGKICSAAGLSPLLLPALELIDKSPLVELNTGPDSESIIAKLNYTLTYSVGDKGKKVFHDHPTESELMVDEAPDGRIKLLIRASAP